MTQSTKRRHRTKFIQFNDKGELLCYVCQQYKPESQFDSNKNNWYRSCKDRRCKSCKSKQYIIRLNEREKNNSLDRLLNERFLALRDRNKKFDTELDFDVTYLQELWEKQQGLCALSKIPMTFIVRKGRIPTNVSIDRIDSTKGYLKENIQLVCMAVNQMKSDLSYTELYKFCKQIIIEYESKDNKSPNK